MRARVVDVGVNAGDAGDMIGAKEAADMAKIGRPKGSKKYRAKAFADGCAGYFASISYAVPMLRKEPVLSEYGYPMLDAYGHVQYRYVPVVTADGEEATELHWTEPPSIQGLCLYLGIDKSTFARYMHPEQDDPESQRLAQAAATAKAQVEVYLISRLEDKSAAAGAKFNLQQNFEWRERREVELGAGAQRATMAAGMTLDEKLALLKEIGAEVPE